MPTGSHHFKVAIRVAMRSRQTLASLVGTRQSRVGVRSCRTISCRASPEFLPPSLPSATSTGTVVSLNIAAWARLRRGDDTIAPRDELGFSENFFYMLTETTAHPLWVDIFDDCLILHAEHTMNASTFTGLVTASTLADPYTVVASSIGALKGPLHGGANEEVVEMLKKIGTADRAAPYVEEQLRNKRKLMGFGHRVYKVKDPRATILQGLCETLFKTCGTSQLYDIALRVERKAGELFDGKTVYPNVDFYSGIIYEKMGIDTDLFTPIFAMARVSGWLAHWLEQLRENKLFRPDQIYAGEHDRPYVPLDQR